MKLSIYNFKTIRELIELNFNSINIISGVNSSEKTSFIQFLLMLKQTLEAQSANPALILDGNWVKLGNFENLIYKKDMNNSMGFELEFDNEHIKDKFPAIYSIDNVIIKTDYLHNGTEIYLSNIRITYKTVQRQHFVDFTYINGQYKINSDSALFVNEFNELINFNGSINTISFLPLIFFTKTANPKYPDFDKNPITTTAIEIKLKEIQNILNDFLAIFHI
jgi:AAA15 family ATPase/GTPase